MLKDIDGVQINIERVGSGKPVLLLHGWGASMEAMRPVADYIKRIGREAVLIDFPGFGLSPAPSEPWGVPEYAALTRRVIEAEVLRGCDLICHSFGGRVTILLASEDPGLFGKLVLTDAAGIRPKRTLKYHIRTRCYKLAKRIASCGFLNSFLHIEERIKNAGSADYRELSGVMRSSFVKVVNLDLTDRLAKIQNETLLVWGDEDKDTPLYMGRIMKDRIPNAGLAVINGAGHYSYLDDFPRFCAMLSVLLGD